MIFFFYFYFVGIFWGVKFASQIVFGNFDGKVRIIVLGGCVLYASYKIYGLDYHKCQYYGIITKTIKRMSYTNSSYNLDSSDFLIATHLTWILNLVSNTDKWRYIAQYLGKVCQFDKI